MADKTYIIHGALSTPAQSLVLGTTGSGSSLPVVQQFQDPSRNQTWGVIEVLGTPYVWIRHEASGFCLSIPNKIGTPVALSPRDVLNPRQLIVLSKSTVQPGFVTLYDTAGVYTAAVIPSLPNDNQAVVSWNSSSAASYWLFAATG
jgi:hypothetical protein